MLDALLKEETDVAARRPYLSAGAGREPEVVLAGEAADVAEGQLSTDAFGDKGCFVAPGESRAYAVSGGLGNEDLSCERNGLDTSSDVCMCGCRFSGSGKLVGLW